MDPRGIELINLQMDKRLDDHGEAELDARLQLDPALVNHRNQLRDVALALRSAPTPEVPAGFRNEVLRRLQLMQRNQVRARPQHRYWRPGLALAASGLLAIVVLRVFEPGAIGPQDRIVGTIAPVTEIPAATVAAEPHADGLRLTFDVPPGSNGEIVIDFTEGGRRIVVRDVTAGKTTVQVAGNSGDFKATLVRDGTHVPVMRRP